MAFILEIVRPLVSIGVYGTEPPSLTALLSVVLGPYGVLNLLFKTAPIVLVVVLVWAGINRMLAADNPQGIKQSTATISWAIIGILVITLSGLLVRLIAQLAGVNFDETTVNFQ